MHKPLKFLSFWSINDALDLAALQMQLDELKAAGIEGVIFHPRYYPNEPHYMGTAYLDIVSELILYAKQIDVEFWLYDENGWPSGTAGGEVIARRPELRCEWAQYELLSSGEKGITIHSKPGVSSFQAEATALFIEITHEAYRKGLKPEAFDYVTGFFSDEVGFLDGHGVTLSYGAVPWDERLPAIYEKRYGEALEPLMELLFIDGAGCEQVRTRYWELLTDMLVQGFYEPIEEWCRANGKRFTAHLKAEEHPYFQLSYSGSCFQVLKGIETPAIDALERYPGNHFYPRLLHSVAVQQGRDGCLVEAMGGSGWGVSPESFTNYILWLAGHGIDQFVLHLNQFKLKTQAVQDWPPSMPSHLTWKDAFPALLASIKQKAKGLMDLSGEPDLLIIVPTRGIMSSFIPEDARQMNVHDGSNVPASRCGDWNQRLLQLVEACYAAGIHYEFTEEREVEEHGSILPGKLRIGCREYRRVLLAEGCLWNDEEIVPSLKAVGIQVEESSSWLLNCAIHGAEGSSVQLSKGPAIPKQTAWDAEIPATNQVLIPFLEKGQRKLIAEFPVEDAASMAELSIVLHDKVSSLSVNGVDLSIEETKAGFVAILPDRCIKDKDSIRIEALVDLQGEPCPIAFLRGRFSVVSLAPYEDKDGAQWMTEGGFKLIPLRKPEPGDLISSGFPFAGSPVRMVKELSLPRDTTNESLLQLTGIHAAAALVYIDDVELGWCWGPSWNVIIGKRAAGNYKLTVELVPSTFNVYGPHRHIDGDRYLTSPDQYKGLKNFADRADAPEQTLVRQWHFVKWGIQGEAVLYP